MISSLLLLLFLVVFWVHFHNVLKGEEFIYDILKDDNSKNIILLVKNSETR